MMRESRDESNPAWSDDAAYALGLTRLAIRPMGFWPLECQTLLSKIQMLIAFFLLVYLDLNLIQELMLGCGTVHQAVLFIASILGTTVGILKMIAMRLNRRNMCKLVKSIVKDWSIATDGTETRRIMKRHAHLGRIVTIIQLSIGYGSLIPLLFNTPPTFNNFHVYYNQRDNVTSSVLLMRNLPMGTGCSVAHMSNVFYLFYYVLQFIQLIIVCSVSFGSDAFLFATSMHVCAQLELLKIRFVNFGRDSPEILVNRKDLTDLIDRQIVLVQFANYFEYCFSFTILAQLAGMGLEICLFGIQFLLALKNGDTTALLHGPSVIGLLLVQLILLSYVGESLTSKTRGIRDAAYNCQWYNFSSDIAKDILFVIMRNSKDFHLTAGKIYRINIENFTTIVKSMVSFFSCIRIMIDK